MAGKMRYAYGEYRLKPLRGMLLRWAQRQPVSWIGRRIALLLRRIALSGRRHLPVDAQVDGFRMRVHVADNVSERKFLFMPKFVDPFERDYIDKHLRRGDVFLDIGANAGIYTLTAARTLQRLGGGRVISVEPNPVMHERLACNVALNRFDGIVDTVQVALADAPGMIVFTIALNNLGESGVIVANGREIEVRAETLAGLLDERKIGSIGGMKIDVEGAEDRILAPFFATAPRSLLPRFVIIENPKGLWKADLLGQMAFIGYRLLARQKMNSVYVLDESTHMPR